MVNAKTTQGREREVAEIIRLRRAAAVGRLMLGELDEPLKPVREEDYVDRPRRELKAELGACRSSLKGELLKFCRRNFQDVAPEDLARLYEPLVAHQSRYRLPLREFVARVGEPCPGVLKGAPAHATVHLSPWGLQTEYPETHLARDLALAYNDAFDAEDELRKHRGISWTRAKDEKTRVSIATAMRRGAYSRRMCLLSCFNLTEAYVNGVAWEFIQSHDTAALSNRQRSLLTEGQASLLDKLIKVPAIVKGRSEGPLMRDQEPLSTFRDLVKPFRDSIVHASPFSSPEQFGGYDKLARVYELEMATVRTGVDLTLMIIGAIHRFLDGEGTLPAWIPLRADDGRFTLS